MRQGKVLEVGDQHNLNQERLDAQQLKLSVIPFGACGYQALLEIYTTKEE